MRHLGIVASSAPQAFAPTVSVSSVTNFNQNRGTFNGTVSANGAITTTIKFQISTNNSTWVDATGGTTITNTASNAVSVFYNATGLSVGTLYYVRLVATNSSGTTNSSSTTFTTWSLKTYRNGPAGSNDTLSGSQTFTIPTITPTGGSQVIPSILDILVAGGGGGSRDGWLEGAGGGGYRYISSRSFTNTSGTTLSISIGAAGGRGGTGAASTILASNFTSLTATGGNTSTDGGGSTGTGGSTPANDNSSFSGGTGIFVFNAKSGESALAGGGGAGSTSDGTNGTNSGYYGIGGNGGNGYNYSTGNFNVGPGGLGTAQGTSGSQNGSLGANSGAISGVGPYGKGGNGQGTDGLGVAGTIGVVYFRYYAA
jgi:hypothetical protein